MKHSESLLGKVTIRQLTNRAKKYPATKQISKSMFLLPKSECIKLLGNYFRRISEGNWPFSVGINSISSIDLIVNPILDSSSDCVVPYGPNVRAFDVANITLAKQIIPKNLV